MGKRKAAKKPQGPKKAVLLPKIFPCLFCNHQESVSVKMDKKAGVGALSCKICNQQFQCSVNYLSAAVDVYSDWVDACDAVAKEDGQEEGSFAPASRPQTGPTRKSGGRARSEGDDDDIIDDEGDDMGYGGEGIVAEEDDEF